MKLVLLWSRITSMLMSFCLSSTCHYFVVDGLYWVRVTKGPLQILSVGTTNDHLFLASFWVRTLAVGVTGFSVIIIIAYVYSSTFFKYIKAIFKKRSYTISCYFKQHLGAVWARRQRLVVPICCGTGYYLLCYYLATVASRMTTVT